MSAFLSLLRAEWTKFRTVRGWVIGAAVAALVMVLLGVVSAEGSHREVAAAPGESHAHQDPPTGPGGESVTDSFAFAYQALDGDGSITVRLSALTGGLVDPGGTANIAPTTDGVGPWAKAGVIVKESTKPGSAYAAIMVTGGHGVRMQYNFTGDIAGSTADANAHWLRLARVGSTLTGYVSADGTAWTKVGTTTLAGLSSTVQIGMFTTSPPYAYYEQHPGGGSSSMEGTRATAVFDNVSLQGTSAGAWIEGGIGDNVGSVQQQGDTFTVAGSGDIAPNVDDTGGAIERTLVGAFAGLTVLIVLGVLFMTTEYRRGMIRTTMAASPHRGRVLAAKAAVIGSIAFVIGVIASVIAIPLCGHILRKNGNYILPVNLTTEARLVIGTAALLAVAAILALAIGTMLRRSAGAVAAVIVLIVLPYILTTAAVLPTGAANWVLRLTPAAAFAIQQSIPAYPQVSGFYTPAQGFYPLGPWTGLAVLCAYAVIGLGLATYVLRRRDV